MSIMMSTKRLTEKNIYKLFQQYGTPDHVIRHCRAVSDAAWKIGKALNAHGYHFDLDLIRCAGLAHDLMRKHDHHDTVGADVLESLGYHAEAEIVRQHMTHSFTSLEDATELDIVCLGDRTVREDEYVGVERRFDYLIHKKGENPERTQHLEEAKAVIREFIHQVEKAIGTSLDSLFRPTLDTLLKQVEKPGRYIGEEINMVRKNPESVDLRFGFAFPDMYEIGMSYVGLQILYDIVNQDETLCCERFFAPAPDMESLMRKERIPLFTLENKSPVNEMDVVGFTLQYEMSYTNVLNMLELSEIPLKTEERKEDHPLIIAGGPCCVNPEPLAEFIDVFLVGDGEKLLPKFLRSYRDARKNGLTKLDFLKTVCKEEGCYVPMAYTPEYNSDGYLSFYKKVFEEAKLPVRRAIIENLAEAPYPRKTLVPLIETVHDRSVVETFRGCTRGCRFCQAGMIYRPVRERKEKEILEIAKDQLTNSGHDELSILSLSTSDYSQFEPLTMKLMESCRKNQVSLSLPSLRLDSFSFRVLNEIQKYKKSGLTFAPEAGTQRLRDVINKGITDQDIYDAVEQAVELGWRHIKLYFMIGLPTETKEDLDGIAEIARNVTRIHKRSGKGGRFNVTVSISNFVPKPHTPFQWVKQDSVPRLQKKHAYLSEILKIKGVRYTYHDEYVSKCEGILARGDRRASELLLLAHHYGCQFDGWTEYFDREKWQKALQQWQLDYHSVSDRVYDFGEFLPWEIIDTGVTRQFLEREYQKAENAETTPDCREGCENCGISRYVSCEMGGIKK